MSAETADVNPLFVELVFQLQSAAWIHMGKVANPGTGKIERNLELARDAIDMLGMIEEKTRGNLKGDEERLLREFLSQVRLNFVSEQGKPDETPAASAAASPKEEAAPES